MTRFWMVTRKPEKGAQWGNPRMRHYSRLSAVREAQRLANHVGEPFVVLGCEEVFVPDGADPETLTEPANGQTVAPDQRVSKPGDKRRRAAEKASP